MQETLTVTEFASLHNVTRSAVLSQIKSGAITAQKVRVAGHVVYIIDLDAESTKSYKPRNYEPRRFEAEPDTHNADGTMTCYGVACLLGLSPKTVQRHAKSGKLFAFKRGGVLNATWHIPKEHPQNEAYVWRYTQKETINN